MARYIDEFESFFAQLLRMGKAQTVSESHKVNILLASMGTQSKLENSCASLRMRDIDDLKWESVTADLIQEWQTMTNGSSKLLAQKTEKKILKTKRIF